MSETNYMINEAELVIIGRDFDLLRKIAVDMSPELQIHLLPYTSLLCYEAIRFLSKSGCCSVQIDNCSQYSIKDIRQKTKLFNLSLKKQLQCVTNIDEAQNYYFISQLKYPILGKLNLHYNIGIWFDEDSNIIGNTHYSFYVFQDDKMISRPNEILSDSFLENEALYNYSFFLGETIGTISSELSKWSEDNGGDFNSSNLHIRNKDYNSDKCFKSGRHEDKSIRLFLLHIMSSIGFIVYGLKKCITNETGLLLRLEYIAYHYSIIRLETIKNYYFNNQQKLVDHDIIKMLNSINFSYNSYLKSSFRNCMMHYGLNSQCSLPSIEKTKYDLSLPLCGLVESQFDGRNYYTYQREIEAELTCLYNSLNIYLSKFIN